MNSVMLVNQRFQQLNTVLSGLTQTVSEISKDLKALEKKNKEIDSILSKMQSQVGDFESEKRSFETLVDTKIRQVVSKLSAPAPVAVTAAPIQELENEVLGDLEGFSGGNELAGLDNDDIIIEEKKTAKKPVAKKGKR